MLLILLATLALSTEGVALCRDKNEHSTQMICANHVRLDRSESNFSVRMQRRAPQTRLETDMRICKLEC